MKIIHIISGILLFLLIAASSASAYELGTTKEATSDPISLGKVQVTAVYGTNTITFSAKDLQTGGSADIKKIGFNVDPVMVSTITDNAGQTWYPNPKNNPLGGSQMDGLGDYTTTAINPDDSKKPSEVYVRLTGPFTVVTNKMGFETCVHVAWTGGEGGVSGSAFVAGIPEFPTVALPVAAILGLMFILQRRKKN